jgi:hypothetical protein
LALLIAACVGLAACAGGPHPEPPDTEDMVPVAGTGGTGAGTGGQPGGAVMGTGGSPITAGSGGGGASGMNAMGSGGMSGGSADGGIVCDQGDDAGVDAPAQGCGDEDAGALH